MDVIKATFVFDGNQYDVAAITAAGLQVECADGFAEEIIRRLSGGRFPFVLRDPATGNEIELAGELVRFERAGESGPVVRIWITKQDKNWSRPARQEPGSGASPGVGQNQRVKAFPHAGLDIGGAKAGKTIAVGGGKGGVGKTIVAVSLAVTLARLQKNVTLLDGDAGNCNCNTLLGITRVESSLEEYLLSERSFDEITVPTAYSGLRLVCGAQNKVDALLAAEMPRLLADIRKVAADYLVIDLGAGMSDETLDLYRIADEKIIVVTPQVTSLQNAYGFIKSAFLHDLKRSGGFDALLDQAGSDPQKLYSLIGSFEEGQAIRQTFAVVLARQRFRIIGNMVNDDKDMKIVQNLQKVVGQYLHIDNQVLGTLAASEDIRNSVNRITPFVALSPDLPQSREIKQMALRLTQ
jgi:flagellar biosynthesis protein FlhG